MVTAPFPEVRRCSPPPRLMLQAAVGRTVACLSGSPSSSVGIPLHRTEQGGLDGVERTGEVKEHYSHCAPRPLQVGAGSVQQVDDGAIHTNLILVCKLQAVHGAAHLPSQNRSLKDRHGTGGQCYWPVVVESVGMFYLRHRDRRFSTAVEPLSASYRD